MVVVGGGTGGKKKITALQFGFVVKICHLLRATLGPQLYQRQQLVYCDQEAWCFASAWFWEEEWLSVALSILNRDLSGALKQAAVSYCGVVYDAEDTTDRWLIYSWITALELLVFFFLFFFRFFFIFCVLHHKGIALSIFSTIWVWRIDRASGCAAT